LKTLTAQRGIVQFFSDLQEYLIAISNLI